MLDETKKEAEPNLLLYQKLNKSKQGLKTLKCSQLDSSYLNASDPNSMRDLGIYRNAEYEFVAPKSQTAALSRRY